MMPGPRALAFVSRWFDPATVSSVFEPLIADWQREWLDAPPARRAWILVRGACALACAVLVSIPRIVMTPAPHAVTQEIATRMTRAVGIIAAILMIMPTLQLWQSWSAGASWVRGSLFFFAIPSILAMAFPFSMIVAVDAIRRHQQVPAHVMRATVIKLAAFAFLFALFFGGWVVPAANEGMQLAMNPEGMPAPLRGMSELSTFELLFTPEHATRYGEGVIAASFNANLIQQLNIRTLMLALPIILIWLRWRARASASPAIETAGLFLLFMVFITPPGQMLEQTLNLWSGAILWLPVALIVSWGIISRARPSVPARA